MMQRASPKVLGTGAIKGCYLRRLSIPRSFLLKCFPHVQGDCRLKLQVKVPQEVAAVARQLSAAAAAAGGGAGFQQASCNAAAAAAPLPITTAAADGAVMVRVNDVEEAWTAQGRVFGEQGVDRADACKDNLAVRGAAGLPGGEDFYNFGREVPPEPTPASVIAEVPGADGSGGLVSAGGDSAAAAARVTAPALVVVLEVVGELRCSDGPNKCLQDCSRIYMTQLNKKLDPFVQWKLQRLEQVRREGRAAAASSTGSSLLVAGTSDSKVIIMHKCMPCTASKIKKCTACCCS
jgi:hypothetical protein